MKKGTNNKPVTEVVFKKFTEGVFKDFTEGVFKNFAENVFKKTVERLDNKIDRLENQVNGKIDRLAVSLVNLDGRVTLIEQTMVTKKDLQNTESKILDRMDFLFGNYRAVDQEQMAQALHIKELKETSSQHEARINSLETARPI